VEAKLERILILDDNTHESHFMRQKTFFTVSDMTVNPKPPRILKESHSNTGDICAKHSDTESVSIKLKFSHD